MLRSLRLMNWYPYDAGWDRLWTAATEQEVEYDFAALRNVGANAVRIIVSTYAFGYPKPYPAMVAKLHDMLALAQMHQLSVQLTLFDFFSDYTDVAGSRSWLSTTLAGLGNDERICFVDLQNEVDPRDAAALAWVRAIYPAARSALGATPLTASVTADVGFPGLQRWVAAAEGMGGVDLYDFHWYGDPSSAAADLRKMSALCAGHPLFIGETGTSSRPAGTAPSTSLEVTQAQYLSTVFDACRSVGLPRPAPWIWRDFTMQSLPDVGGDPGGLYFGLLRVDGTKKPAYEVVRQAFAGDPAPLAPSTTQR